MMSKLGGHRQIIAFLNRFLGPSSSSSSSFSNGSCFLRKMMICCPKYGSTSQPKHGAFLWNAQAALVFGGSCSFVFAQDISSAVPNDVGLQPVQDGSVISNEHTSKWRIFTDNGREYFMKGKLSEAEKLFSSALAEAKKGFGEQDPHVASACNNLAELYRVQKLYDKAEPLYLDAISILEAAFGPEDVRVGAALHNLGQFYIAQRKFVEARVCYERSLKIKGRILGHGHADYAETMFHLGTVLYLQGNVEDAEALIQDSIRILEEGGQGESFSCIRKMRYLAKIYSKSNNQLEEAENVQRKILHIMELTKGWDSLDTVIAAESLSVTLQSLGKLRDAGELLERCLNARRKLLPKDHIQIGANFLGLANLSLLNFETMKKIGDSEALLELGRAEKLLSNSVRISQLVLDKTKGKINTWNNGQHIGRDHQTALIIMLMSLKALAQVELSRLGEQKTPEALLEAKKLLRDCIRAFGEYGATTSTSMFIDAKRDYVCSLKNLLNLIIDRTTTKDAEQSRKAEIQELKNEIRLIEENISLNK